MTAHARSTDPFTSHLAALSVNVSRGKLLVLAAFERHGKMTDTQLVEAIRLTGVKFSNSGIRSRRAELVQMGVLRDSGEDVILPSGRRSIIWEIAP